MPEPTVSDSPLLNDSVPLPSIELNDCENPLKPTNPPAFTINDWLPPNAVALPANSEPPVTTVGPEYELLPARTSEPAPALVSDPVPATAPFQTALVVEPIVSTVPPPASSVRLRAVANAGTLMPSVPP